MKSQDFFSRLGSIVPVVLQKPGDDQERYRGVFLTVLPDDMFLVQVEEVIPIKVNEPVIIRMVQDGSAIGFESSATHMVKEPVGLYFFAMPASVESVALRKTERMDVFVPCEIRHEMTGKSSGDTMILQGYLTNVSSGGCRVLTKRPIPLDSAVRLSFNLPLEKHLYTLSGNVLESSSKKSVFGHRVRFFPSDKNVLDINELRRWVKQNIDFADLFQ